MSGYKPKVAITIPKPCNESWEAMAGDARVRHCGACGRDVRNVATMTPSEIDAMLAAPGPMPCMRIVRYQDGSLLTARVEQKPGMLQRASMMLSTVMLMAGSAAAQSSIGNKNATLTGRVVDPTGASIPRASVELRSNGKMVATAETDAQGDFSVQANAGEYVVRATSPGFETFEMKSVALHAGIQKAEPIALLVGTVGGPIVVSEVPEMAVETPLVTNSLSYAQSEVVMRKGDSVLLGKVVDPYGTVVPGVTVGLQLRASDTTVAQVQTNDAGVFRLIAVPGDYSVVFSAPGFMRESFRVKLSAGTQEAREAVKLPVAFVGIVVEVPMKTKKVKRERTMSN